MCSSLDQFLGQQSVCIMCRHRFDSLDVPFTSEWSPKRRPSDHQHVSTAVNTNNPLSTSQCVHHICTLCLPASSDSALLCRQRHHRQSASVSPLRTTSSSSYCPLFRQSPVKSVYPLICKFAHRLSKMSLNSNLLLTFFLYAILSASQVTCDGMFELRVDRFTNELNRDASGQCCGLQNSTSISSSHPAVCEEKCQTFFRVCFKNYQANIDPKLDDCLYGQKVTEVLSANQITAHVIKFPFTFSWPGTFSLIIEAWNNASAFAPATNDKTAVLIGRYYAKQRDALAVSQEWTSKRSLQNQTSLHFSYRVLCQKDYFGNTCANKCTARDDNFGHYNCGPGGKQICHPGWTGEYCDRPVCNHCNSTNGECIRPNECRCRSGWTGKDCTQCIKYPNCKHGSCSRPWECICEEGWGGLMCNLDLNYCTNHRPCKNNGTCSNTGQGSFTCSCPPGFAGVQCEKVVDVCEGSPCQNGATCKSNATDYTCHCPTGFQGDHCEHPVSACASNPCDNDGTCVDGPSGYLCVCKLGFSGSKCQVKQKDCQPNPCLNGGNCLANSTESGKSEEGYTCQCRAGFTGDHCEVNINDCESNPCLNSGSCVDEINSFRCLCVPGFVGELCQVNVDDCLMKPCANGGVCSDRINDYTCTCPPGYTGKDCSVNVDDCAARPCLNGGTCRDLVGEFECSCTQRYYGSRCEFSNSTFAFSEPQSSNGDEGPFSSGKLPLIIFGSISLPLLAIIILAVFIFCRVWRRRESKMKSRRDEEEARRQNEHNAVMSGLNNKCLDQCLNPSAANVIVNALDRTSSLAHLNKCGSGSYHSHYSHASQSKVTNEYVYGPHFAHKAATLQKDGYKTLGANYKALNTDCMQQQQQVKLSSAMSSNMDDPYSHTYEQLQKPSKSNLLTNNLSSQQIYQTVHAPKQSNLDIYASQTVAICPEKSDCNSGRALGEQFASHHHHNYHHQQHNHQQQQQQPKTSQETAKVHCGGSNNLQNNIQFAATLQRMQHQQQQQQQGCRSNSVYVIENHYSQPIYNDPKSKLQATEV